MNPIDQNLINRLKVGDELAFKELVDVLGKKVYNTCLGFVPNAQDAEDVTQEVFIEVYRSIHKFRGDASVSTWVYRVAITKCLDHIKASKRSKRFAFLQSLFGKDDELRNDLPGDFRHPGVLLEDKENAQALYKAIDQLPDSQRTAYTLHNMEGLSYKDIAEVMETSVPAVESLLFRAKKGLQDLLHDYYKKNLR